MTSYRIEYSIQRCDSDDGTYEEVGFGSSGSWPDVEQAAHMLTTDVQHRQWETRPGMPDPDEATREAPPADADARARFTEARRASVQGILRTGGWAPQAVSGEEYR